MNSGSHSLLKDDCKWHHSARNRATSIRGTSRLRTWLEMRQVLSDADHQANMYPNREVVVYALYLLGGDTERIHTEDIALKCFELFPASFSWVKYPEHPDKDIVRVALTDARKEQHGALVEGRAGQKRGLTAKTRRDPVDDGWLLTSRGIRWIQENLSGLQSRAESGVVKGHRQKLLRQLKRVRDHGLFAQYLESPEQFSPMVGQIADLLRCRVDAEPQIWQERFAKIRRQAESANQTDLLQFIMKCEQAHIEQH